MSKTSFGSECEFLINAEVKNNTLTRTLTRDLYVLYMAHTSNVFLPEKKMDMLVLSSFSF